jgi:hypothetical protein
MGHFRLPTARLRSCSGASADPQKADHIRAPALVVSRVPGTDIASIILRRAIKQKVEEHDVPMIHHPCFGGSGLREGEKRAMPMAEAQKLLIGHHPKAHFQRHGKSLIAVRLMAAFKLS